MNPNPHPRKKTRKGDGTGMSGFSAGAKEGLGLSDVAQQAYNKRIRATLTSGYDRYLFDVKSMLVPGTNQLKGMYQLPGSPKFAGGEGSFDSPMGAPSVGGMRASTIGYSGAAPNTIGNRVASQPGGMGWFRKGSALGAPPAEEKGEARSLLAIGGLAYIVLKVLL